MPVWTVQIEKIQPKIRYHIGVETDHSTLVFVILFFFQLLGIIKERLLLQKETQKIKECLRRSV